MTTHTVARGENLTRIARRYGIRHWRNLYFSDGNQEFMSLRPDPNLIHPGDVIHIPSKSYLQPVESKPRRVYRDYPLFRAQSTSHTCWRASAFMLWARKFKLRDSARGFSDFEKLIGPGYNKLPDGLPGKRMRPLYVSKLHFREHKITGITDINRVVATHGPAILVLLAHGPGGVDHAVIVTGYDAARGYWTLVDPIKGGRLLRIDFGKPAGQDEGFKRGKSSWSGLSRKLKFDDVPDIFECVYTA
ncbi:MAG: LysM domain-containing protein [Pseudomonadota bacterium]